LAEKVRLIGQANMAKDAYTRLQLIDARNAMVDLILTQNLL
jgi:hypothetical protein